MLTLLLQVVSAVNYCPTFTDDFNDILDTKVWQHDITLSGGGNWEFEYYTNNRTNSYTENGILYINPTYTADRIGLGPMLNGGSLDLWNDGCTNNAFYGCSRQSNGANIINPIQSALIRTKNTVSMKYGKLEVRARLPKGDWKWPAIWLMPRDNKYGTWPVSGEIDIMEARGNGVNYPHGGYNQMGSTLHWGPDYFHNGYKLTHQTYTLPNGTFADDFHVFGLQWNSTNIVTYVDDPSNVVLSVDTKNMFQKGNFGNVANPWPATHPSAPFDQEFYLIMNVAVGGMSDFFPADGTRPWSATTQTASLDFWNARGQWMPTWPTDNTGALAIDWVKVYKQC
ncbi:hypothetical protein HK103_004912 [Boothiomyces macroporosus]|uniref:GH16 domain-containing protein n=1 Tax=Boothiomyces macroporosus TaxID=261099 RepID=A0AAD5Y5I7_9FUNG|nr:hypothetical protein HK103_004912 [Boothiomyces macroporosus]